MYERNDRNSKGGLRTPSIQYIKHDIRNIKKRKVSCVIEQHHQILTVGLPRKHGLKSKISTTMVMNDMLF